ncbi:hypothetical protein [Gracilibacillus boraciitolerans]|nr:hypothetical protein [Gracilibacillus boraciitolerans]
MAETQDDNVPSDLWMNPAISQLRLQFEQTIYLLNHKSNLHFSKLVPIR